MLYYNGYIFQPEGFVYGGFRVENGRFAKILPGAASGKDFHPYAAKIPPGKEIDPAGIDLGGAMVLPGLVDIHVHGAVGADFSDGDAGGLRRMGEYLASCGTTSFAPTSMTLPCEKLAEVFQTAETLRRNRPARCARIPGIHMEGPFLSKKKKGAQNSAWLREPDFSVWKRLHRGCGNAIRIVDLAPELPGAAAFARQAAPHCTVSAAHTDAAYEEAAAFFDAGASHLTHLFNAMPPLLHRAPGPIGAAAEREHVTTELICDGLHIHPSAVRTAFQLFPGRICLISDAVRCCGMPDGEYELGGQTITLRGRAARLPDGTLAGSAADLFQCVKNAIAFGIPAEEAIRAATILPARVIGAEAEIGSIEPGKRADFIVCDNYLERRKIWLDGVEL